MTAGRAKAARLLDDAVEGSVVLSFTRIGPLLRRRLMRWRRPRSNAVRGKRVVVTGGTSGVGRAAAQQLGVLGAELVIIGRDERRGAEVVAGLPGGQRRHRFIQADLTDLRDVRRVGAELLQGSPVDVLVHGAGAMFPASELSAQGIERTLAVHVVAPFLLTALLMPALRTARGRVIVVTSGGMYTEALNVAALRDPPANLKGAQAYARAKRAQVALVERAQPLLGDHGVNIIAMHPGWADTPGLRASLPGFGRLLGPLLRSPDEGADTITWLAAAPAEVLQGGTLWLDRAPRAVHRLPRTRASDTPAARAELWRLCEELTSTSGTTPSPCAEDEAAE